VTNLQDKKTDKLNIFKKEDWSSAYQNVEKELTKEPLKISKGNNIKNLNGTLLRNGPGILERGGQWVHHPFDGDGMITSIKFENGQPFLTNRFVKTKGYLEEEEIDKSTIAAETISFIFTKSIPKIGISNFGSGKKTQCKILRLFENCATSICNFLNPFAL